MEEINNKIVYDSKFFGGQEFYDHWNLKEHPLYINISKKVKPYMKFDEVPHPGYVEVTSLQEIANYLRKNEWSFENKYWKHISSSINSMLFIPYS